VHVKCFDSTPITQNCMTAKPFCYQCPGFRNIRDAGVHCEGSRIIDEVVDGLCVG
jgi:hypothetical protein